MVFQQWLKRSLIFIVIVLVPLVSNRPQKAELEELRNDYRPGKYVPELYGAALGRYMPDYRGQYQHIHIPYDGGYGDRGEKYEHDLSGVFKRPFALGMRDHLRFLVDFNHNGSGWQVIQFEWVRDGDENRQYNYVKEDKLWDMPSTAYDDSVDSGASKTENVEENGDADSEDVGSADGSGDASGDSETKGDSDTNVHVTGEYVPKDNNGSDMEKKEKRVNDAQNIQDTLRELLDYIQIYIIPTLN